MPTRRARPSLVAAINEDIPSLSLPEVKARLERNTALLASPLFASPPDASSAGSSSSSSSAQIVDPVRDKLVKAREALLMREQELMMENMDMDDPGGAGSAGFASAAGQDFGFSKGKGKEREVHTSGKMRVLDRIRRGEGTLAKNGLILPIDQTLSLGQRDYINQTASSLSSLSLEATRSSSPKPRHPINHPGRGAVPRNRNSSTRLRDGYTADTGANGIRGDGGGGPGVDGVGGDDEVLRAQRLARLGAFMNYKGDDDEWSDEDDDSDFHEEDDYPYNPEEDRPQAFDFEAQDDRQVGFTRDGMPRRRENELGEEIDEFGEEDDEFAEGNDDYRDGDGDEPRSGAPGR
ncbi:hypothetical protein I350_01101 [Cryptococcus amylolentus CBS 6273]|uniref:Uncharacterized protein n=1 Tax=Cryptococcus amylolentus CBS 6273 TaxID=1296118 RepID=A0A1E3KC06_9TREE|nr:hypothetical protein I350_01101 [Cryptococcus amylolentus CBS 6273]